MDKKLEKSNADKVLRKFAKKIAKYGFLRTKPTYFVRESELVLEFIHVHKYTFGPCFRMHVCIRVLNESSDSVALAGPTEKELQQQIQFVYDASAESLESCAEIMSGFVEQHVEPWFKKWSERKLLLQKESPLYHHQKEALEAALRGEASIFNLELSKALLKIA